MLVARFNLHIRFLELIDREINNARNGLPASIIIKLSNLEEKVLIKSYTKLLGPVCRYYFLSEVFAALYLVYLA